MTWLHIITGLLALVAGAIALYAKKGATLHRRAGTTFACAMGLMSGSGAALAALQPKRLSVVAGLLTFYLVATAWLTVRRPARHAYGINAAAMIAALLIGATAVKFGLDARAAGNGQLDRMPAALYFAFASVALLAAALDARVLLVGELHGAHRLARHLWRMCFALFLATASFFLGQAKVFPAAMQNFALLSVPVLAVVAVTLYWLVRLMKRGRM